MPTISIGTPFSLKIPKKCHVCEKEFDFTSPDVDKLEDSLIVCFECALKVEENTGKSLEEVVNEIVYEVSHKYRESS